MIIRTNSLENVIDLLINGNATESLALLKKRKSRYNRDLLKDCADSPVKFLSAIKKLYPTKLPFEQGSAFMINGSKSTDKSFIANSFCEYFSTIARNLKSKLIVHRDFVWSKPAEENLPPVK